MSEAIPLILSFCLAGYCQFAPSRLLRCASAITGVALIAAGAFFMSGESGISYTYFVLDLLLASLGLLAGLVALRFFIRARELFENGNSASD